MRRLAGPLALTLTTCAAEPQPAELAEICGASEPTQILALDAGEEVLWLGQLGEQWAVISRVDAGTSQEAYAARLLGPCGEDPVALGEGVSAVFEREEVPDVLLGCREGDLVTLDRGGAPPAPLIAGGCSASRTAHGWVRTELSPDEAQARVLFYPHAGGPLAGPIEPVVLLDPVAAAPQPAALREEVLALNLDGAVVRVSLPEGKVAIEQADAVDFRVRHDGRYLLWQDALSSEDEGEGVLVGDLYLRDRVEGGDRRVGRGALAQGSGFRGDFVALPAADLQGERLVEAATGAEIELPPGSVFQAELEDGRLLLSKGPVWGGWTLYDPAGGEEYDVTGLSGWARWSAEALDVLSGLDLTDPRSSGPVNRFYFDGRAREMLARRATVWTSLRDDRVVTLLDLDASLRGDLVLVERGTLEERPIDRAVTKVRAFEGGVLTYAVREGQRSGVWLARLAAE